MIFQLVYKSTAASYLAPDELLVMLERSRANNARLQITGLLLYHDSQFLQLLEGDEATVRERYEAIAKDRRHKWVSLIMTGPNGERDFPDWTMGFRDLGQHDPPPEGWSSFLDCSDLPQDFIASSRTCEISSSPSGNGQPEKRRPSPHAKDDAPCALPQRVTWESLCDSASPD